MHTTQWEQTATDPALFIKLTRLLYVLSWKHLPSGLVAFAAMVVISAVCIWVGVVLNVSKSPERGSGVSFPRRYCHDNWCKGLARDWCFCTSSLSRLLSCRRGSAIFAQCVFLWGRCSWERYMQSRFSMSCHLLSDGAASSPFALNTACSFDLMLKSNGQFDQNVGFFCGFRLGMFQFKPSFPDRLGCVIQWIYFSLRDFFFFFVLHMTTPLVCLSSDRSSNSCWDNVTI